MNLPVILSGFLCVVAHGSNWGYDDEGPQNWEGLCRTGRSQSPIDIRASDVEYALLHRIHFVHYDHKSMITLANNGHSVSGSGFSGWVGKQPYITNGGLKHKYKLEQFHLHWADDDYHGSEHTLGGLSYPAELHLVHYREDLSFSEAVKVKGGLAVVGIFLTIGEDSRPFDTISNLLGEVVHPGNNTEVHGFSPRHFIPRQHEAFYRYDGSLTTPGCFETVIWTVLAEPLVVTKKQMEALRKLHSSKGKQHKYNYRPTQEMNGRRIWYRPNHFDKSLLCSGSSSNIIWTLILTTGLCFTKF